MLTLLHSCKAVGTAESVMSLARQASYRRMILGTRAGEEVCKSSNRAERYCSDRITPSRASSRAVTPSTAALAFLPSC